MIRRTGRLGQACACASLEEIGSAIAPPANPRNFRRDGFMIARPRLWVRWEERTTVPVGVAKDAPVGIHTIWPRHIMPQKPWRPCEQASGGRTGRLPAPV